MSKTDRLLPKKIRFDKIREIAEQIRSKHCDNPNAIPVPIENIIEFKLGIEIRPEIGLKNECDVEGFLSNDLSTIYVDTVTLTDKRFPKRLFFTLAHELGHYYLHGDIIKELNFDNYDGWVEYIQSIDPDDLEWFEKQANEFAGRFLVPREPLLKCISELKPQIEDYVRKCKIASIEIDKDFILSGISKKISEKFMVSHEVIKKRIYIEHILEDLDLLGLFE